MTAHPNFWILIPARIESKRLPGKILKDINGKPMIAHVIERAFKTNAEKVIVATDSEAIRKVSNEYGAASVITSNEHPSGSDRICEALRLIDAEDHQLVINLQGDEPLIKPEMVNKLAETKYSNPDFAVATIATPIRNKRNIIDPNSVKVVFDQNRSALYFSRGVIPYKEEFREKIVRSKGNDKRKTEDDETYCHQHIGIYAFEAGSLKRYISQEPCGLEKIEKLEQLRWLWMGEKIKVLIEEHHSGFGIDTMDDLSKVRKLFVDNLN